MRPGSIALGVAAAAVAVGGLYLYLSLDGEAAAPTPEQALAAARADQPKPSDPGDRPTEVRDRARAGMPPRRANHTPDQADTAQRVGLPTPQVDLRKDGTGVLDDEPAKFRADLVNPQEYDQPTAEQSEMALEANKLYDKGDFDGARNLAQKLLTQLPDNVKLLRVVVSSSCIMGEGEVAQNYAAKLPQGDKEAMVTRCSKFQIDLK